MVEVEKVDGVMRIGQVGVGSCVQGIAMSMVVSMTT